MLITATGEMLIAKKDSDLLDILDKKFDEHNVIVTQDIDPEFWRVTIVEKPMIAIGVVKNDKPTKPKTEEAAIVNNSKNNTEELKKPENVTSEVGRGIY